jgi:hypothetical protein
LNGHTGELVIPTTRKFEAPTDTVLDRVQFLVNNLAPSNVESKAQELKDLLKPKYFGWLGHFLVVKRISTQANFHSLFLTLLDKLGEYGKGLVGAILDSVYHNQARSVLASLTNVSLKRSVPVAVDPSIGSDADSQERQNESLIIR